MFRRGPRNSCLALAQLATVGVANAASFDCNKASTEIECAICRDPALSQLDGEVESDYRARLAQNPGLRRAQIAWIRDRGKRCSPDVACMTRMVRERIGELEGRKVAGESTATYARPSAQPTRLQPALDPSPPPPVVEIPQIEPLDLDRIERIAPPPPPPKDPVEELVGSYFDARKGQFCCGQCAPSYRHNSDLAGIYQLDAADLKEPRFSSHRLSDSESATFSAWQSCHLYATQQRWTRLIPAISYSACSRAAASVYEVESDDRAQNGLADVLDDLKSSCASYAESDEAGAQFTASVRHLANRVNLFATAPTNRSLAQCGDQRRKLADAAIRDAALTEQKRVRQESAQADRPATATKPAEESRRRSVEIAAEQAVEDLRVADAKKKECDPVLKEEDTINRIALQTLDRPADSQPHPRRCHPRREHAGLTAAHDCRCGRVLIQPSERGGSLPGEANTWVWELSEMASEYHFGVRTQLHPAEIYPGKQSATNRII